jgi:hypothetical protein
MKKLIALISTEGRTPKEIKEETWKAWEKYQKASKRKIKK